MLALAGRKPWLLRPLLMRALSRALPPAREIDPAERLGIRLSALRTAERAWPAFAKVLMAASRCEISPDEALRLTRRIKRQLRAGRRRNERRL